MIVQIYSMTSVADAVATAQAGADLIGVVIAEPGVDWSVSRTIVERSRIPVILAGGLSAENVGDAIAAVKPWGVDSFTHTDVPGQRGKKDPARVRAFIAAALRGFAEVLQS